MPKAFFGEDGYSHAVEPPTSSQMARCHVFNEHFKEGGGAQLARELGIGQGAAWRLGHKIREAWNSGALFPRSGEGESDEAYLGGKVRNKHNKKLRSGRGAVGKQPVMGFRERESGQVRAFPLNKTDGPTLKGHVRNNVAPGANIYTESATAYRGML